MKSERVIGSKDSVGISAETLDVMLDDKWEERVHWDALEPEVAEKLALRKFQEIVGLYERIIEESKVVQYAKKGEIDKIKDIAINISNNTLVEPMQYYYHKEFIREIEFYHANCNTEQRYEQWRVAHIRWNIENSNFVPKPKEYAQLTHAKFRKLANNNIKTNASLDIYDKYSKLLLDIPNSYDNDLELIERK